MCILFQWNASLRSHNGLSIGIEWDNGVQHTIPSGKYFFFTILYQGSSKCDPSSILFYVETLFENKNVYIVWLYCNASYVSNWNTFQWSQLSVKATFCVLYIETNCLLNKKNTNPRFYMNMVLCTIADLLYISNESEWVIHSVLVFQWKPSDGGSEKTFHCILYVHTIVWLYFAFFSVPVSMAANHHYQLNISAFVHTNRFHSLN